MKKKVIFDMLLNIVATSIPTVVLQLIILPLLSNYMDGDYYGLMLTILAILNIVPSTIGNILNNIRLLYEEEYKKRKISGDFQYLLLIFQGINFLIMLLVSSYYFQSNDYGGKILLFAVAALWLGREYHIVAFRLKLDYVAILINNVCMVFGYGLGYLLFMKFGYWQWIYLLGYVCSYAYIAAKSFILTETFDRTELLGTVTKDTMYLIVSTILARAIDYADKILLYPLMGGTMVAVYYAATVFGKVVSLAITPINSVALSYLSKMDKKSDSLFKWTYLMGIVVSVIGYIFAIILSRPVLSILYPKYVDEAMKYILITSATIVISVLISMITPFILRYFNIKWQIWINGFTTLGYIIISYVLLRIGGLMGFCFGALIANVLKLAVITYIFFGKSSKSAKCEEMKGK